MEKDTGKGGINISFDELNWQYSLDDLDSFKDLTHLINLALQKIRENIPNSVGYFFVLQPEYHEYKEVVREGKFSIAEDSDLITYLAIKNEIINKKDIGSDVFFKSDDEKILNFLFSKEMGVNVIIPVVYRFRMLGFIAIALKDRDANITKEEKMFLKLLKESLKVSLFAAILIDKRFHDLLTLVDLSRKMEGFDTYEDVSDSIVELASQVVNFDRGVFYEYDPLSGKLCPRSMKHLEDLPELDVGQSVSGCIFEKKKPVMINNIKEHVFFNEINREKFISFSFISVPLIASKRDFGVLTIANSKRNEEFSVDHLYLLKIVASVIVDVLENKILYQRLEKSYFETVSSLATALEAKDKYTRGHSERVMHFSVGIAEEMNIGRDTLREIKYAAVLHDIGKIGISENIITKPGKLTDEEYEVIQSHPEIGADILSSVDFLKNAKEFVRYHHEKINGTGYYGKKLGEFPYEAMIIALADSFDALTSDRPYRKATHPEIALKELKKSVGKQFDQPTFDAFIRYLKKNNMVRQSLLL
ncbi:MAG: hypothetical protein A2Y33_04525 [Spirochaetes bacterium GWF1_51_8]|nr:MAG: hypothetical protein A2Y33_04525 [Spirochaetes bacterium GWF1_51_8]